MLPLLTISSNSFSVISLPQINAFFTNSSPLLFKATLPIISPEFLFIVLKTSTSIDPSPLNPYSKSHSSITLPKLINSDVFAISFTFSFLKE